MDIVQQCLKNMYALARNAQSAIVKHISSITLSDVKSTQMHYLTGHGLKYMVRVAFGKYTGR